MLRLVLYIPYKLLGVAARKNTVRTCDERGEFPDFCREVISYFGLSSTFVVIISLRFRSRIRFRLQVPHKRSIWIGFRGFNTALQANATIVP